MSPRLSTILFAMAACGGGASGGPDAASAPDASPSSDVRTLDSCPTSIAADAPAFYRRFFRCVTITTSASGVTIATEDLPPHESYYWGASSPNYAPFDTHGGTYHANPNTLAQQAIAIAVPSDPTPVGVTITSDYVDGQAGTNSLEYSLGAIGVAIDGVALYAGFAAPGDDLAAEAYTFDSYDAHPDNRGTYHYHTVMPGALEAAAAAGESGVEVYGVLCDGTIVLGCTELDGSAPAGALDAQGGHTGELRDQDGTLYWSARYHVHVCATGHVYTPEIHDYAACK
jgi:hypothetical protein